jgi:hypothetical protein
VAASSKEDDLKALRLQFEKEEELLRMKQQENEHRMRILKLQLRIREAEDDISQNGSEKVKNWLHNDNDSICEDVKSQKSGAVGGRRQQERVPEVPRSLENVDGCSRIGMSKVLARQMLEMDLPKFSGDVKEWPTFITTFRRTTFDCEFSGSENMERLRKCLSGPLLEQLLEEAKAQKDHLMFRSFQLNKFFLFF